MTEAADVRAAVAEAHRREWAFVLAATVRVAGDLDLAQECVQDAYVAALDTWSTGGVPGNPAAWLTTVARRRVLNAHRGTAMLRAKLPLLVEPVATDSAEDAVASLDRPAVPDDRLRLVFTCCHPALARQAQVGLTLRLVCGMTTVEIARAFLVSEGTMAARVTRAKKKIAAARIPFRAPDARELPARLDAVLTVVYLLFTTGHTAPAGADLVRADLVERAIELATMLHVLMPDEREVTGLLALIRLTDARRATRTDRAGKLVVLAEQDRSTWDRTAIEEAAGMVPAALRGGPPGRFALQAAIAALHAEAHSLAETDWPQVVTLYDALLDVWPSPVVALNRAVALSMSGDLSAALAEVQQLESGGALAGYRYLPATRADLLRRLGRGTEAVAAYRAALRLTEGAAEREYLAGRIAELTG